MAGGKGRKSGSIIEPAFRFSADGIDDGPGEPRPEWNDPEPYARHRTITLVKAVGGKETYTHLATLDPLSFHGRGR